MRVLVGLVLGCWCCCSWVYGGAAGLVDFVCWAGMDDPSFKEMGKGLLELGVLRLVYLINGSKL